MLETPTELMLRKVYPLGGDAGIKRLAATCDRIDARIRHDKELAAEKEDALAWCRANGNPHRRVPVNSYLRSNISDSTPYAGEVGKPGHCNGVIICGEGKR